MYCFHGECPQPVSVGRLGTRCDGQNLIGRGVSFPQPLVVLPSNYMSMHLNYHHYK